MTATLRIRAVGDVGLVGRAAEGVREHGTDWLFAPTRRALEDADVLMINLEMPFAPPDAPHPPHVPPSFRADPDHGPALRLAVPTVACVANNHLMDFGTVGLDTTLETLHRCSIVTVGAGADPESARAAAVLDVRGVRLGVLAFAAEGPHSARTGAGCAIAARDRMIAAVTDLVDRTDVVVVHVHGGLTYVDLPSPEDRTMKRDLIRAGAKVVLGHHPHVWQGVERIDRGLVAHSLGEFVFDGTVGNVRATHAEERRRRTGILEVRLDTGTGDVAGWDVVPCTIGPTGRPEPSVRPGDDRERIARLGARLDAPDYDASFRREAGRNLVGHEMRVLLSAIRRADLGYFWEKMTRIRVRHLRFLFAELKRRVRARLASGGARHHD